MNYYKHWQSKYKTVTLEHLATPPTHTSLHQPPAGLHPDPVLSVPSGPIASKTLAILHRIAPRRGS